MKTLTQSEIDQISSNEKLSLADIAKICDVSLPTARKLCIQYGFIPSNDSRKYKPNDNYFKTWSNEMAYFLGLIAADGHIRYQNSLLMINLVEKDRHIIESMKRALEYDGPIYTINKKGGQKQSALTVTSKIIAKDLNALGLSHDKTYNLDWIQDMPDQFVSHFVRGLFCGDGCIHINEEKGNITATLVGTYKLTENLKIYYNKVVKNDSGCLVKKGNVQTLEFNGKYNALAFLDWIYTDSTPETRLSRKYDLYLKLKNTICEEEKPHNNSKINQVVANEIRVKYASGKTGKALAEELNVKESVVYDVALNRTWANSTTAPIRKNQGTIEITFSGVTHTIGEWEQITSIPYNTLDRRYREFQNGKLTLEQVFHQGEKRLNLGITQSEKNKKAEEMALLIRTRYSEGIRGKLLYEGICPKSRAMDLILNRTCKEENVWWKN